MLRFNGAPIDPNNREMVQMEVFKMVMYYDKSIENDHTREGGTDAKLGFGQCALPLILEHNTPNNAVSLLWADTEGKDEQHAMRPLFRRRQRHV